MDEHHRFLLPPQKSTRSKSPENMPVKAYCLPHPPWSNMITECITTTPDGTRYGVSRPAIKKFVDSKYHLPMNAAATTQLNRAITHGTVSGNFVLPKGPSGKVKLAPERVDETTKKAKSTLYDPFFWLIDSQEKKRAVETKIMERPVAIKPNTSLTEEQLPKPTRKYTSMAKKARITPFPGRQAAPRKATTQRIGAKRPLTRLRTKKGAAKRRGK